MAPAQNRPTISNELVRIILFNTLPGYEKKVAKDIRQRCRHYKIRISEYRIFRLFGCYDLVFIQDNCELANADFVKFGAIQGIAGSTEHICYKWQLESNAPQKSSFSIKKLNDPLLGLCFLKINPILSQKLGILPEEKFAEHLKQEAGQIQMLGTLGWAEVILLMNEKELAKIISGIGDLIPKLALGHTTDSEFEEYPFAEKTISMIGHGIEVSAPVGNRKSKRVDLSKRSKEYLKGVRFSAVCVPQAMKELNESAKSHFFDATESGDQINFRLGPSDLEFQLKIDDFSTLNELIDRLDNYRKSNIESLIRTHTELQCQTNLFGTAPDKRKLLFFDLSAKEAKKLVDLGEDGVAVASAVYKYNNLVANRLLVDAYSDLAYFVNNIKDDYLKASAPKSGIQICQSLEKLHYLEEAIIQRAQGAYLGLEESPFGLSSGVLPAGMGIHRLLKAIEFYPANIFRNIIEQEWGGFALIGHHPATTMEHRYSLLMIPAWEALSAKHHWALTHEVMHALQHVRPKLYSAEELLESGSVTGVDPAVLEDPNTYLLVNESIADVMDYEYCCPLEIDDYQKTVWSYLGKELVGGIIERQLDSYLIRTFAVTYFDYIRNKKHLPTREQTAALLKTHIKKVSQWVNTKPITELDRRGQAVEKLILLEFINDHVPFIVALKTILKSNKPSIEKIGGAAMKTILDDLSEGVIIDCETLTAHASSIAWILSTIEKSKPCSNKETIALVLSLWNAYQKAQMGPDMSLLTKK